MLNRFNNVSLYRIKILRLNLAQHLPQKRMHPFSATINKSSQRFKFSNIKIIKLKID